VFASVVAFVASQAPLASILTTGYDPFSIYQPAIYEGYQWFLLIPAVVSLAAIYWVETSKRAFLWLFIIFLTMGIVVMILYKYFAPRSEVHLWNWLLWNCLIAIGVAIALHVYLRLRRLGP